MGFTYAAEVAKNIGSIFQTAFDDPEISPKLVATGLVVAFDFTEPDAVVADPKITGVAGRRSARPRDGRAGQAVVHLREGYTGCDELAAEIIGYVRGRIAGHMAPRSVDFVEELPRLVTGKLAKKKVQKRYTEAHR